jgi:hypothetical protein
MPGVVAPGPGWIVLSAAVGLGHVTHPQLLDKQKKHSKHLCDLEFFSKRFSDDCMPVLAFSLFKWFSLSENFSKF